MSDTRTKTRPGGTYPDVYRVDEYRPVRGNTEPPETINVKIQNGVRHGGETITYGLGPKYSHSGITSLNWKSCLHSKTTEVSGRYGSYTGFRPAVYKRYRYWSLLQKSDGLVNDQNPHYGVPDIDQQLVQNCVDEIFRNIDLNCDESVMCYSAVLQAIPLVGSAVKVSSVLNKIGRDLSRSWKRKPFTTVIKSLISGDFINRFVVQTTLQDMRMVANSTNYVLKTLMTAASRNREEYTVLESSKTLSNIERTSTGNVKIFPAGPSGTIFLPYTFTEGTDVNTKVKWIAKLRYNLDIVSPIQLWATRVGLTKPLESFWDMVPFSFVADYFFRTGDFLTHLSNEVSSQDGLRGLVCSMGKPWAMVKRSAFTEYKTEAYSRSWTASDGSVSYLVAPSSHSRRETSVFTRDSLGWIDLSGFWDRGGLWDPQLSFTRGRTMGQLWLQAKL
jgi:hypothetical protein